MKAVTYSAFGPARDVLTFGEVETPAPEAGQVLVRLRFSGVNPSDVKVRAGGRPGVTAPAFPQIIPHSDGAGVIEAVGEGVDAGRFGQKVWIWNGQWQRAFGTAAEYIALDAKQAVPMPGGVTFETGAILGIPGLTAAQTVFGGGEVAGQTVLVSGGGGTVGYPAVQLATWGGARVIATASPRDFDRVKEAGADMVLDYRDPDLAAKLIEATDGQGLNRAVEPEFGANVGMLNEAMAVGGPIAAYGSVIEPEPRIPFMPMMFKMLTIDMSLIYVLPTLPRLAAIAKLHEAMSDGALRFPVQSIFELTDCAAAHEAVEAGGRAGAILVRCT
jgi:NADPH2:quinone reductase